MIKILELIYISVGILTLISISVFTLCQCFHWGVELINKIRNPYMNHFYTRKFAEMSLAFRDDERLTYIFDRFQKDSIWGWSFDTYKFRDEVNEKFKK